MAAAIRRDHGAHAPHLVCVLKGAFVFAADLIRALGDPSSVDFMAVSSYGAGTSPGDVRIVMDLERTIEGRSVVIVEDIVDTGATVTRLRELLGARRPESLRLAALLSKPSRRTVPVVIDYLGFEIPDVFVVGYGLDHDERYRDLPYVAHSPAITSTANASFSPRST